MASEISPYSDRAMDIRILHHHEPGFGWSFDSPDILGLIGALTITTRPRLSERPCSRWSPRPRRRVGPLRSRSASSILCRPARQRPNGNALLAEGRPAWGGWRAPGERRGTPRCGSADRRGDATPKNEAPHRARARKGANGSGDSFAVGSTSAICRAKRSRESGGMTRMLARNLRLPDRRPRRKGGLDDQ
jgi:hypothetical protein